MFTLAAALSIAIAAIAGIDVPYIPQTPALCGGAAAAMVLRYWGDRHADPTSFAPLVDQQGRGIATNRLVDAIRQRRWRTTTFVGTLDAVRDQLAAGHPIILLLEDRPGRYHYVVAVGADAGGLVVHDPEWGPSRHLPTARLLHLWRPSGFWALLVLPDETRHASDGEPEVSPAPPAGAETSCDRLLSEAVAKSGGAGAAQAADLLDGVRLACPDAAAPLAELAGVRFAEHRWREAAALAKDATARDASQAYAWDVLGSSLYVLDDLPASLSAWNHIGRPRIDSVSISGLTRTRYAIVADAISLKPNSLLTGDALLLAERRLGELPDQAIERIGFRPGNDGFAVVDVAVTEHQGLPRSPVEWAAAGAKVAVNREMTASWPGAAGLGQLWSASWRWWANRPRVAVAFAAPLVGAWPGVWRVDAAWDVQTYTDYATASPVRERQFHTGLTVTNWITSEWRYELSAVVDTWDGRRKALSAAATIERHLLSDRLLASAAASHGTPLGGGEPFSSASLGAAFRSTYDARGLVMLAEAGVDAASASSPLSNWFGAGDGRGRAPLLRAHPLLDRGIVTGPVFGRGLEFASAEVQAWLKRPTAPRLAVAAFVDTARAFERLPAASGNAFQIDAGLGVRLRIPAAGSLRVDYAHGMRDGRQALTLGWLR